MPPRSGSRAAGAARRGSVGVTGGDLNVSPVCLARSTGCPTSPALQGVPGAAVPPLPRDEAPCRLPLARLRTLRVALAPHYRAWFCGVGVSPSGSWSGRPPQTTPGPLVTRAPNPGVCPGDTWLSQGPALPLGLPAPLVDPGGLLGPRHVAPRPAAVRPRDPVGVPRATAWRDRLSSTTIRLAGRHSAACLLAPSSAVLP